jgi:hypothetical protein
MQARILGLAFCLMSSSSFSGEQRYHCEITEQITVDQNGRAKVYRGPLIVDRKLAIDRKTGQRVGNAVGHLQADGPQILAAGNAANSFVAVWVGPSAGGGVHLDVLRVEEFASGTKKPFMAVAGGTIYVGLCD